MSKTQTLYCQTGEHEWERKVVRGKVPINCPEHRTASKPRPTTQTLFCKVGQHEWTRDYVRGALPHNCPEHKRILSEEHKSKMDEGRLRREQAEREAKISSVLESPRAKSCHCDITPQMTDQELRAMCSHSCTSPMFICATLDSVIKKVYTYD